MVDETTVPPICSAPRPSLAYKHIYPVLSSTAAHLNRLTADGCAARIFPACALTRTHNMPCPSSLPLVHPTEGVPLRNPTVRAWRHVLRAVL